MTPVRGTFYAAVIAGIFGTAMWCQSAPSNQPSAGPVKVNKSGDGVTAPQLISQDLSGAVATGCDRKISGTVKVSAVLDQDGVPHNLMFVQATGSDLDRLGLQIMSVDRFTPAIRDGAKVATGALIITKLEGCVQHETDAQGKLIEHLRLGSIPEQTVMPFDGYPEEVVLAPKTPPAASKGKPSIYRVGSDVTPPRALLGTTSIEVGKPAPDHPSKPKYQGEVMVALVVDVHGMPEDVRVIRPLGMGLDEKAVDAIRGARFRPAMRKGKEPVPVLITVAVNFTLY